MTRSTPTHSTDQHKSGRDRQGSGRDDVRVVRRTEDQNPATRKDLPGDSVQPGINEASDDPN